MKRMTIRMDDSEYQALAVGAELDHSRSLERFIIVAIRERAGKLIAADMERQYRANPKVAEEFVARMSEKDRQEWAERLEQEHQQREEFLEVLNRTPVQTSSVLTESESSPVIEHTPNTSRTV